MANNKNTYAKRKKNGTAFNIGKGVAIVLVAFLAVGLIGSVFGSISGNDVDPNEPDDSEPLTFRIYTAVEGDGNNDYVTFTYEPGMTWADFIDSSQNIGPAGDVAFDAYSDGKFSVNYHCSSGGCESYLMPDVILTDLIVAGQSYGSPDLCI